MATKEKRLQRERRARAYNELRKSLSAAGIYVPSATSLFEALGRARLSESYASSTQLSRDDLFGHLAGAVVPEELSDSAIAGHLGAAARLYATAAGKCVLIPDPGRAFKYFRRAAKLFARAARLQPAAEGEFTNASRRYKEHAALARGAVAKRRACRRRWGLGLLRRWC